MLRIRTVTETGADKRRLSEHDNPCRRSRALGRFTRNKPRSGSTTSANEAAWKEDHRRLSNGELSRKKLSLAMEHPVSRVWSGYWQRHVS